MKTLANAEMSLDRNQSFDVSVGSTILFCLSFVVVVVVFVSGFIFFAPLIDFFKKSMFIFSSIQSILGNSTDSLGLPFSHFIWQDAHTSPPTIFVSFFHQ